MKSRLYSMTLVCIFISTLFLSGCAGMLQSISQDDSQQLVIKTTIQFATATYLDKNSDSVEIVLDITDKVMLFLTSDNVYGKTTVELQMQTHDLISSLDLSVPQKIALTSLADVILAEAVAWAEIGLGDKITQEHANALFFCANAMNETAKMYIMPESEDRSYSIN